MIGIVFPPFVALLGVRTRYVLTPWFFAICMAAGFLVGAVNIGLARMVVGRRLRLLAARINKTLAGGNVCEGLVRTLGACYL